ncbi:5-formyltetrahydrofolate cyclo-ligase [Thermosediminibacter oceani]|uniref:5-formyltetrahydrofolate cyclo-ligase n=1 Tax=Thermosediminibacter oceani (strain ATCC BAA-1034 / DSM 16646 / JW/IW-1228P) TaxID=555079 RepID=D9S0W9_THEOJ|nr:5-formyltetrahydrofolate cyclo-ligase [Thermosediminibacter oceani]ADL07133.1 5-formyltetrahydrofolate cyclo-ligase [Thermosediminibacter oceani DSM 16646]
MVDKKTLRRTFLEKREGLSREDVKDKSEKIISTLFALEELKKSEVVMFYVNARNEVETRKAIEQALSMGKRVVVPKTIKGKGLLAVEIKSLGELVPGTFGILEPEKDEGLDPKVIDLVVVPGVAFDRRGYRLGYGGGYYDGFLPKLRPEAKKIAIAFELQLADYIPVEKHDVRMDAIVTEKGVYRFN